MQQPDGAKQKQNQEVSFDKNIVLSQTCSLFVNFRMISCYLRKHPKLPDYLRKILGETLKSRDKFHTLIESKPWIRNFVLKEIVCSGGRFFNTAPRIT
jgi:hypothetical protein